VTSVLVYYVICTYVSKPTEVMIDEAVYPLQKGETSPLPIDGEEVEDTAVKAPYFTSEKEVSPV
jgi:NCS1 family nucleobase:cation symporter-1